MNEGYSLEGDGALSYGVGGVPLDRIPADGTLAFLVEEFDHCHDCIHRHGTLEFVEAQRRRMLERLRGVSSASMRIVALPVAGVDADVLEEINGRLDGRSVGLLRERLDGMAAVTPRL